MPPSTTADWNPGLVQVNVGDFRVSGLISCDISKPGDDFSYKKSVDGFHGVTSRINDNMREASIVVQHNSGGYKLLFDAYQKQLRQSDRGAIDDLAFSRYDPLSGQTVSERHAIFKKGPDMSGGQDAPEYTFVLILPNPTTKGYED